MNKQQVIQFEDLFYLLLFREEIQNKSLMRFGKTRIPQVNNPLCKSRFSIIRAIFEYGRSSFVMHQAGKYMMEGGVNFLSSPIVVQETPDFIIVDCNMNTLSTPADLELMVLPDMPDRHKGVVVNATEQQWMTSHLVVEYSKIADWVAVSSRDYAVVVFSISDAPKLGTIIEL